MEGKTFSKMMKDCGLYDKKFTATSADITFSKAKPKGERRISLKDFCFALDLVAEEKGMSYDDLVSAIASSEGPASSGTKADAVKFHDDKSMYTGAHNANLGGSAKIRERKDWRDGRELPQDVPGLEQTFNAFCTFGGGQAGAMDNAKFAKLCADSGLINKKFTSTDADIIFSKVKPKGERRISYMDFLWTVDLMAESKQTSYGNIANSMLNGGPASSGTKADAVRFHDDKSQYTVEGGARAETPA